MESDNEILNLDNLFDDLKSKDNKIRQNAFQTLLQLTEKEVDWVYIKWFDLINMLTSKNSFHRIIGLLLLANLSKSDCDNKISEILNDYLGFFDDEKFITSRQCIQNVWKIAISNESCTSKIIAELERAYYENAHINKHGNLIKQDVISSMHQIYLAKQNREIIEMINSLILSENDENLIKDLKKIIEK